ncbi:hypothetical protein SARC_05216 [Sphaeroforma arctica JP610]|uniref:Uncharacterized protein n=1 Tax=Sphaeroforma arctica JP610 TaxID=667725 RepID=A0A0L0G119_9EUKA|nr:hypothetical protein SARC_05216 [Sphaeroforma arctica JP610]KNC82516.1 hypothetical protein SARC_05216 [Sphaeroforma arctica JP610]|eukprot:XP_014156418.1 hypothetical protein SARC_05216 [Sphaeroforma arctica JP610]
MGEPPTAISSEESPGMVEIANTNSIPGQPNAFIYSSGSHAVRLRRINFKDTGESGKMCTVGINYVETPLNLTLTPLPVDGNDKGIKLGMDMGPIYQGEHVKLMTVGQCESPSVTNKLVFPGVVVPVTDGICTASAHVYVPVASVAGCGLKSSNEDTLGSYEVPITVKVEEEVWHQSKDVGNQAALMRETSAEISLSFTLNEETKILAQCYETSAVPIAVEDAYSLVNMVDIKRITTNNNDSDMSEATLSFRVPAPYTLTGGDAENYTLEEDCTASPCVQKSTYNISGCRLGGLSHFTYPIKCQEGAADCPSEPATSIEVAVNVIMNSFCELTFKDIFETTQVLYTDDTYTTEREASDVYKVKDQICQKLSYLPKEHPDVSSNEIVMLSVKSITREVLNDTAECEDWDGTASMGQAFQVVPPGGTINYCFSVSNKMSCPIINGDGLNPMNVTTTVEFEYNGR